MATNLNLVIEQKAAFERRLVYQDVTNRPVNLTGYTAKLQVRATVDAVAVLLELSTENGGIVLGGKSGRIDLYISGAATTALNWTTGVYDLILIPPNGRPRRLVEGTMTVTPGVTTP